MLKGSGCAIADAFAHDLANVIGLPVPNYRLVYYEKVCLLYSAPLSNTVRELNSMRY